MDGHTRKSCLYSVGFVFHQVGSIILNGIFCIEQNETVRGGSGVGLHEDHLQGYG